MVLKLIKMKKDEKQIFVAAHTHEMFQKFCKTQKVPMREAMEKITRWLVVNKIDLKQVDTLGNDMYRIHNYTVSYLKQFEKEQLSRMDKMIMAVMSLVRSDKGVGDKAPASALIEQVYLSEMHQLICIGLEKLAAGDQDKKTLEDIRDIINLSNQEISEAQKNLLK